MARPLGRRRRWWREHDIALGVALGILCIAILIGTIVLLNQVALQVVLLAMLVILAIAQSIALLAPPTRDDPHRGVLRYLRAAPFRRASRSGSSLLVNLRRRRMEELRRTKVSLAGLDSDRLTVALLFAGIFVMLISMNAAGVIEEIAEQRYDRKLEKLDPETPTFDADRRAALDMLLHDERFVTPLRLGGFPAFLALACLALARGEFIRRRTLRRLDSLSCPDCGYSLHSAPNAIDPARLGGLPSGPVACPECGSPWPLIPPPTTEEVLAEAARRTAGGRLPPRSYL